ncbi:hypothetical protein THAOC_11858, partial [Thalassiosira oceanica]
MSAAAAQAKWQQGEDERNATAKKRKKKLEGGSDDVQSFAHKSDLAMWPMRFAFKASRRASGQVAKRKRKSQASNGAHLCCAFKDASARADATAKQLGSNSEKDAAARALADEEANKARILAAVAAED